MAINPLQATINYAVDVKSPFEAALGGIQIGAGLEELNVARQKRAMEAQQLQAAQEQQATFRSGLNSFFAKPPEQRTFEELQPLLIGANKQQFDALKLVGEQMGAERLGSAKRFSSQVLLALEANPATAQTMLEERIAAETDPNQKRGFQTILDLSKEDPAKAAQFVESLGAGTFGKDWYEGITSYRNEQRTITKPADEGYTQLTKEEVIKAGLPPGAYQKSGKGEIKAIVKEPLVSVSVGQQGQRDTLALKELDIPRAQEFSGAAASARTLARDARVISNLLKGKGGGAVIKLGADIAKNFGFSTDTVVANDLANSLAIRGATQMRPPGSGSTSDVEFKAFVSAFPSLANSEGGRELMAKYADAFAKRTAKIADHARKLIRADNYSEEEIARFDESLGSILAADFYDLSKQGRRENVPVYTTPAAPAAPVATPAAPRTVDSVLQQYLRPR